MDGKYEHVVAGGGGHRLSMFRLLNQQGVEGHLHDGWIGFWEWS